MVAGCTLKMGVAIEGWMFRMKLLNLIEKTVKTK